MSKESHVDDNEAAAAATADDVNFMGKFVFTFSIRAFKF